MASELRTVIRTQDQARLLQASGLASFLQHFQDAFTRTGDPHVVAHDGTVKYIYDRCYLEEPALSIDVAVLDVSRPQLVGRRWLPVPDDFPLRLLDMYT